MAVNFPTSLDNWTNPTGADTLATTPHSTHHGNHYDAIEALEGYAWTGVAPLQPLSAGFESFPRGLTAAAQLGTSQRLYLTGFTAPSSFTVGNLAVWIESAGTASTLSQLGIYSIDGADAGTLLMSTTNDTALFASSGLRSKSVSTPTAIVKGTRYAFAMLQNGGSAGTFGKMTGAVSDLRFLAPFVAARRDTQTSLASFTKANLTSANSEYLYFQVTT